MLRKILLFGLLLGATFASHAQFARQNFAPQVTTELSPAEAQRIRESMKGNAKNSTSEVNDQSSNQLVRALKNELQRIQDSVRLANKRGKLLKGQIQDSVLGEPDLEVFGADFFKNASFSFAPGENFPTPENYVVGPGDVIDLVIFGFQETEMELKVSPEGSVNIPFGGVVQVSGLSLSEVEERIKVRMSRNGYQTLSTGKSKLKLSISKIRSISVFIVGSKNSGKYTIPSISGVMHALYVAGGPMLEGSYRNIDLVRNGSVVANIDLYDFMINGRTVNNLVLQNNDIIRIPFYQKRIALEGEFKRPAYYELKESETYADGIAFAGGFTDNAFKQHILGTRYESDKGLINFNLIQSEWTKQPQSGDRLTARSSNAPRDHFAVVEGAVYNPGIFGWTPELSVGNLLNAAGGVHPDAFKGRGLIVRSPLGQPKKYLMFSLEADLASISLERRDTILVFSRSDFMVPQKIRVLGEVKEPGDFTFGAGLTLADALAMAQGFTEKALKGSVVVSRSLRSLTQLAEVFRVEIDSSLLIKSSEFELKPNDVVMVRKNPEINDQRAVSLEGEWTLPGVYSLSTRYDQLKVIFNQAQGLSPFADPNGIMVLRPIRNVSTSIDDELASDSTETTLLSAVQKKPTEQEYDTIAIHFNARSVNGLNFALQDGDRVLALEGSNSVRITGAVQKQTFVMHRAGRRAKFYIRSSGGFNAAALKSRTYVRYQNGQTRSTINYGLVRIYPRVSPGSIVVVPENLRYGIEKKRVDPAEVAVVTSLLGFLSTTTITILQLIQ